MKILVTGGAGFIGSHIVDALINEGHEVVVVDNLSTGKQENLHPAAVFLKLDLCDPDLLNIMQRNQFAYVIHHAAQVNVRLSVDNPSEDAHYNIIGTLNLLRVCLNYGVKGVIFASSGGAVYGETEHLPAGENNEKGPLSPYGVSKLSVEYYLYCFARVFGLPYLALRYGNVYGPRQDADGESGVVASFGKRLLLGEAPVIFGDGEQIRDYVYVQDVVEANLLALKMLEEYHTGSKIGMPLFDLNSWAFNIASGKGTSVNDLYKYLKNITGYSGSAQYSNPRPGELQKIFLDAIKAQMLLGWKAKVDLAKGLGNTIDYLKKNLGNA